LDELAIYDRALAATEIQSIYNAGSAGKCKPPDCSQQLAAVQTQLGIASAANAALQAQLVAASATNVALQAQLVAANGTNAALTAQLAAANATIALVQAQLAAANNANTTLQTHWPPAISPWPPPIRTSKVYKTKFWTWCCRCNC